MTKNRTNRRRVGFYLDTSREPIGEEFVSIYIHKQKQQEIEPIEEFILFGYINLLIHGLRTDKPFNFQLPIDQKSPCLIAASRDSGNGNIWNLLKMTDSSLPLVAHIWVTLSAFLTHFS
jgi:hypothetical protein